MTHAPHADAPSASAGGAEQTVAIELRGVSKRYGAQTALEPLDLDIHDGEFFCLLGPSGCGKTTTLNLIGGFATASSGTIAICGERVDRVPPHKRNVNTVFQSYALFPHMTVAENVGFGLKMARVTKAEALERVRESLDLVGLGEYADRYPAKLSGGQQQRVAVARALVNRPEVLLLDEPLGALDLKLRKRLQVELSQIHREVGTTFVFVTHDQEEAMAMADRIAVMHGGRLEQVATPEDIYLRPASRFVADFIGESNFIDVERRADGQAVARDGSVVPAPAGEAWRRAALMVRPECLSIADAGTSTPGLDGSITQISFLGGTTRVTVDCPGAEVPIVAALHGSQRMTDLPAGGAVHVSWDPANAVVLDATT
ncbi:MAG TPA: ABC transporter ATP-binding protein [Baekduia sp.]|nr:ABC transporter ATP-binding protein [Baekduia sp.]